MIDLSWLEKAAIELVIIILIAGGCWIWGDVHGHNAESVKYQAQLASAQVIENNADAKIQALTNQAGVNAQAAIDNQKESDSENAYSIKLEKEIKNHPKSAVCKPSLNELRIINGAGKD